MCPGPRWLHLSALQPSKLRFAVPKCISCSCEMLDVVMFGFDMQDWFTGYQPYGKVLKLSSTKRPHMFLLSTVSFSPLYYIVLAFRGLIALHLSSRRTQFLVSLAFSSTMIMQDLSISDICLCGWLLLCLYNKTVLVLQRCLAFLRQAMLSVYLCAVSNICTTR